MKNGYIMWSWKHDSHRYIIISASHALIEYTKYGENCAGVCVFVYLLKVLLRLKVRKLQVPWHPPQKMKKKWFSGGKRSKFSCASWCEVVGEQLEKRLLKICVVTGIISCGDSEE